MKMREEVKTNPDKNRSLALDTLISLLALLMMSDSVTAVLRPPFSKVVSPVNSAEGELIYTEQVHFTLFLLPCNLLRNLAFKTLLRSFLSDLQKHIAKYLTTNPTG